MREFDLSSELLGLLLAVLLLSQVSGRSEELVEDFDSYPPGEVWSGGGHWIVENPQAVGLSEAFRRGTSGRGVRLGSEAGESALAPLYKTGLNLADESIAATCFINLRDEAGRFDFYLRGQTANDDARHTMAHLVLQNGKIFCGVYGGELRKLDDFESKVWIELTIRVDLKSQCYDVYANKILLRAKLPFSSEPGVRLANVDMVVVAKNEAGPGQAWVDDLSVIAGSKDELSGPLSGATEPPPKNWVLNLSSKNWTARGQRRAGRPEPAAVEKNALGAIVSGDATAGNREENHEQTKKEDAAGGIAFSVSGSAPQTATGKWRWRNGGSTARMGAYPYYAIKYKAKGITRAMNETPVISVTGNNRQGKRASVGLLDTAQVVNDGRSHLFYGLLKEPFSPRYVDVDLTTRNSMASLEIESLSFFQDLPGESAFSPATTASAREFDLVDLQPLFNDSISSLFQRLLKRNGGLQDGAPAFPGKWVQFSGIPFRVNDEGDNLVLPVENKSANAATVPFLGVNIPRWNFAPVERNDAVTIPVNRKASEAFFILANEFARQRKRYGAAPLPFQFDDIDATFCVELHYADGETETAFPYSLADHEYVLRRTLSAYVVPLNAGKELKQIVLLNRAEGNTTGVAALTLNTAVKRLHPELLQEPELVRTPPVKSPPVREAFLLKTPDGLKGGNSYYRFSVSCSEGFAFTGWANLWPGGESVVFPKNSGFEIAWKNRTLDGRSFKVRNLSIAGTMARIVLGSKNVEVPLEVTIAISVDAGSQLKTRISVQNLGGETENVGVQFPILRDLKMGSLEETWMFFPKYGNVNSNQPGTYEGNNDLMFPMQFFDIYNPRLGGGLALLTHHLRQDPIQYLLSKNGSGVSAAIRYPEKFGRLESKQTREYPETCLVAHGGDWHEAFRVYKDWLASWYKPYRSQDKEWFINLFWIHSQITSSVLAKEILYAPAMFDRIRKTYRIDEVLKADEEVYGSLPDAMNLYSWGYSDRLKDYLYGGSPEEAYEGVGGLALFKEAIHHIQDERHLPVSLYLYPGPCGKKTAFGQAFGPAVAVEREDGSPMEDGGNWYACPGSRKWRDYFVKTTRDIQRDTKARIVYLDVFGFSAASGCISQKHDHAGAFSLNQGTSLLMRALREALPPDVAIWHEYPVNDVCSQWSDGNIAYYYLPVRDLVCPIYDVEEKSGALLRVAQDVYRYAFPRVKQFGFPCGIEGDSWGHLKFPFFNGEGTLDTTWRLYTTRARQLLEKSLRLERQYADCFNSSDPEPLVPTERAGVYANKFPGKGRTVWTIYNERFTTVRGTVLALDHREGAVYRDLWNGVALTPQIKDGKALIDLTLAPQGLGGIVQAFVSPKTP